eukprot:scaffold7980_cov88-Skeletonema_menzelii.AAC.1
MPHLIGGLPEEELGFFLESHWFSLPNPKSQRKEEGLLGCRDGVAATPNQAISSAAVAPPQSRMIVKL